MAITKPGSPSGWRDAHDLSGISHTHRCCYQTGRNLTSRFNGSIVYSLQKGEDLLSTKLGQKERHPDRV